MSRVGIRAFWIPGEHSLLSMMLAACLSYVAFLVLRHYLSTPNGASFFYPERMFNFVNCFFLHLLKKIILFCPSFC